MEVYYLDEWIIITLHVAAWFPTPSNILIDHMHMTSQKGAHVCWGSNEALPRGPSPSMQPAGQPLHAIPPGWAGWSGPRTDWGADAFCQHNMCAQRDKSWPPAWRRCYGDVTSMHKVYTCITVLTNQVWKLLITMFKVPNTGALMVQLVKTNIHVGAMIAFFPQSEKKKCFSHSGFHYLK